MASRLNKKFALTLACVSVAVVVVLGPLAFLAYRANTTRHIKAGDQLMAGGDYEAALKEYGRAVAKEKSDLSHLQKYEQALLRIRPRTQEQAVDYYNQFIGVFHHKLRYRPFDAEVHLELLEELHSRARLMNRPSTWNPVYEAAKEMENGVSRSDPLYAYMKLYKGLAILRRNPVPSDTQIQDALRNLAEFVEAVPDNDSGWAGRVEALLATAELARASGNKLSADKKEREAKEMLREALRVRKALLGPDADGLGPELSRIRALWWVRQPDDGDPVDMEPQQEIGQALDRMVELITESNDSLLLMSAADILGYADRTGGRSQSIRLLQGSLSEHPENHLQRLALANFFYQGGSFHDARTHAQTIIDAEPVLVSFLAVYQPQLRVRAAALIVDVEFKAWEQATAGEKASQLLRAKAALDRLGDLVAEPETEPLMLEAEGKIATAEGNFAVAADMFERAVRAVGNPGFEILWYTSLALEEIGEFGSALMRIDDALSKRPGNIYLLRQKARVEARLARFDDAQATIEEALRRDPENEAVQLLAERIRQSLATGDNLVVDAVSRAIADARVAMGEHPDPDAARTILLAALQEHGEDEPSLLYFLTLVEIEAEQLDTASEYLDRAIQLHPNNKQFLSLKASIGIDDPIERLKQALAARYPDEINRTLVVLIGMRRRAWALEQLADRYGAADDQASSEASAREQSARAHQEADAMLVRAREIAADHSSFLEYLLGEAVRAEDWEAAEVVLQQAREHNSDQADGLIFQGRYELVRSQTEKAVQTLTAATNRKPYSAVPWQLLGRAYELLGHNAEAQRAYEEAYNRAPGDRNVARLYVNLLQRVGDKTRALGVLRDSRRLVDGDQLLQDAWLRLEADVGDSVLAIRKRRGIYDLLPGNRLNAMRLAELLGRANPSFRDVLNEKGVPAFDLDRWRSLPAAQRTELLEQTVALWIAESNEILDAAEAQGGDRLELAFLRADLLQRRGEIAAGEQILRDYLGRRQEDELTVAMFVALGQYQLQSSRVQDAVATFKEARAYQDPKLREADRALINVFFAGNAHQEGIDLCNELLEINYERALALRVVEGYLGLGDLDQADQYLQELVEADGIDFRSTILEASLAGRRGDRLSADGQADLAAEKYQLQRRTLARSQALRPNDPTPHVQTAQSLLHEFHASGMRNLLDEAFIALDSADKVRASAVAASMVRVDVQMAMGDVRAAIGELTRLLERSPDNVRARALLVSLFVSQGERNSAIAALDAAIERYPLVPTWHEARGDLLRSQDQPELAAKSYVEAYRLSPSARRLTVLIETLLNVEPPDIDQMIRMFMGVESSLEAEPELRSLYARVLNSGGQREKALDQLRIAHREYRVKEDQEAALAAQNAWARAVREMFPGPQVQELEQFVFDVSDDAPTARELTTLARSWFVSGPDGRSRAIELQNLALEQALEGNTQFRAGLLIELGTFLLIGEDYRASIEAFDRAIELEPNNSTALNNAAFVYAEHLGELSKGLALAERADELRPDQASILDTLGWIHYRLEQFDQAESALRRSIDHRETAESVYHLACVLFKQDRLDTAETYLSRAMELRPDPKTRAEMERLGDDITRARNR